MEETADSAGESADQLEGFSEKFQGAMGAAVAALAVGAAGLLSQVPVLGESFAGLAAIVEALAFQMDGVLRPVLSPLTDWFYEASNAIYEMDGAFGTILGVITTIVSILAVVIGTVATVAAQIYGWASVLSAAAAGLAKVAAGVGFLLSLLEPISTAILIIIGVIALLTAAWTQNWFNIRGVTEDVVGWIMDTVVGGFKNLVSRSIDALGNFASDTRSVLKDVAARASEWASDLASDAKEWGNNLIQQFIQGIRNAIGELREFLNDLQEVGASVGIDVPNIGTPGGGGGSTGGSGSTGRPGFRGGGGRGGTYLDGRDLSESTGRYRADPARRGGL